MAAAQHTGVGPLTPREVAFLAEDEPVTIVPRQRLDGLDLISVPGPGPPVPLLGGAQLADDRVGGGGGGRATFQPSDRHNAPRSRSGWRWCSSGRSGATWCRRPG